jgi:hypothetical protein
MLGKTLAQIAGNDTAKYSAEQRRIEAELEAFRNNIFGDKEKRDSLDSIAAANPKALKAAKKNRERTSSSSRKEKAERSSAKKSKSSASSGGSFSVRRQRH